MSTASATSTTTTNTAADRLVAIIQRVLKVPARMESIVAWQWVFDPLAHQLPHDPFPSASTFAQRDVIATFNSLMALGVLVEVYAEQVRSKTRQPAVHDKAIGHLRQLCSPHSFVQTWSIVAQHAQAASDTVALLAEFLHLQLPTEEQCSPERLHEFAEAIEELRQAVAGDDCPIELRGFFERCADNMNQALRNYRTLGAVVFVTATESAFGTMAGARTYAGDFPSVSSRVGAAFVKCLKFTLAEGAKATVGNAVRLSAEKAFQMIGWRE